MEIKILQAEKIGYCWGVERAIREALKSTETASPVYLWGELLHNEKARAMLLKAGLKEFSSEAKRGSLVLGPTHGLPKNIKDDLHNEGFILQELTCPIVDRLLKKSQSLIEKGFHLLILGDKNHSEIKYITSYLSQESYTTVNREADLSLLPPKIALVVQTTRSLEDVKNILANLGSQKNISELFYSNTLCGEILQRQEEGVDLANKVDLVLVVGDKKSANSRKLFELISQHNQNTHLVSELSELNKSMLDGVKSVGIVSGASTPQEVIEEIVESIKIGAIK